MHKTVTTGGFSEDQKVKTLISAAQRDPDPVTCFNYYSYQGGMVMVVKDQAVAEELFKWLQNQRLTTENPIPKNDAPPNVDRYAKKKKEKLNAII